MKKTFLILMAVFVFCSLKAADPVLPAKAVEQQQSVQVSAAQEQFKKKINELINKRRQISLQIYQQRVQLIKEDPALKVLHEAILSLHTKMANELNANPKIVPLMDKGKEIDNEIAKLISDYQADGKEKK